MKLVPYLITSLPNFKLIHIYRVPIFSVHIYILFHFQDSTEGNIRPDLHDISLSCKESNESLDPVLQVSFEMCICVRLVRMLEMNIFELFGICG